MPNITSMTFNPPRHFRMWDASGFFSQILFRSSCDEVFQTIYDIRVWGVEYLDIAWEFTATEIVQPRQEEFLRIETRLGNPVNVGNLLVIVSETGERYYVVAIGWILDEFEGDPMAPALAYMPSRLEDPGKRPKWVWR